MKIAYTTGMWMWLFWVLLPGMDKFEKVGLFNDEVECNKMKAVIIYMGPNGKEGGYTKPCEKVWIEKIIS